MNILISGSSFLLPKNKAWNSLAEKHHVEFAEYGNWSGSLLQAEPEQILILVIFLDDLIDLRTKDLTDLPVVFENFYNLLEQRLNSAKTTTVVCFASDVRFDAIRNAKIPSKKELARNTFFDEARRLAHQYRQLHLIDLDCAWGAIGRDQAYDPRNWYLTHCRLSPQGLSVLANGLNNLLHRAYEPASKVLVLDCDNTLWGGVIGEDGVDGLVLGQDGLGQAYVDFQMTIKELSKQGVILVLASKNHEDDVWGVFDNHQSMVLTRSDISLWKINWDEKFESIQALANELDLSLESFVFWDDNPVEREKIKMMLPQVFTVDVEDYVFKWPDQLSQLVNFAKFSITKDDLKKKEQYQTRAKFVKEKKDVIDEAGYLKSIKLKPTVDPITLANISRAEQLCHKTNQFNLRSIRHTAADLHELAKGNSALCFLTSLSDVYGDHGVVGLVCMRELDEKTLFLDTFLQSCRVLGRHLESWMLQHALNLGQHHGYDALVGEFIPTKRNKLAATFLEAHGFEPLQESVFSGGEKDHLVKMHRDMFSPSSKLLIRSLYEINLPFVEVYEQS